MGDGIMSEQHGKPESGFAEVGDLIGQKRLTRRDFLTGAAAIGAFAALGPLASACGSSSSSSSSMSPSAVTSPKKGGLLTAGIGGGSAKDILDAHVPFSEVSNVMHYQMYDALLGWDEQSKLVMRLAESVEANSDATKWTVKLKSGLAFHDDKPVTADDVVYSFQRILDPQIGAAGSAGLANLKPRNIKKIDDLTVQFVLDPPSAIFYEQLAYYPNAIVPVGYERPKGIKGAIGTGPWKVTSYTPGRQIEFAANPNYWGTGPYADRLKLIEFSDPTAKLNALIGHTIDYSTLLESAQVRTVKATPGLKVVTAKTGAWNPFTMRVDKKPFDDVRVRQAMKLILDRQQMIDLAYGGFGWVGNDIFAPYDPGYPKDLPQREQDFEQAKSLLKQAGYDNDLTVTLNCSTATGAADVQAAQVFAQQATGAGVTIKVNKVDPSTYWNTGNWGTYPFAMTYYSTRNYLAQVQLCTLPAQNGQPAAPYWTETWWDDAEWLKLFNEAILSVDDTKRGELVSEMGKIDHERGGYIIYEFGMQNDAYSDKLAGVAANTFGGESATRASFNLMYFV